MQNNNFFDKEEETDVRKKLIRWLRDYLEQHTNQKKKQEDRNKRKRSAEKMKDNDYDEQEYGGRNETDEHIEEQRKPQVVLQQKQEQKRQKHESYQNQQNQKSERKQSYQQNQRNDQYQLDLQQHQQTKTQGLTIKKTSIADRIKPQAKKIISISGKIITTTEQPINTGIENKNNTNGNHRKQVNLKKQVNPAQMQHVMIEKKNIKQKEKFIQKHEQQQQLITTQQQQNHEQQEQQQDQQDKTQEAAQSTTQQKVKCRFYPDCKTPNCQFHHPTQECKFLPHCKYGAQCMNKHPRCTYGQQCQRPNCFYEHPPGIKNQSQLFNQMFMMPNHFAPKMMKPFIRKPMVPKTTNAPAIPQQQPAAKQQ